MSDLRLFADTMHALIAADRRQSEIAANADRYGTACRAIAAANLPLLARPSVAWHKANEGLCAVRIILAKADLPSSPSAVRAPGAAGAAHETPE